MPEDLKEKEVRRILDVDVREVSLVDRAANLRQFLVVKRLEEDMGAFTSNERSGVMAELEKGKKMTKEEEEELKRKKEEEEKAGKPAKKEEEEEKAGKPKMKDEEEKAGKPPMDEEEEADAEKKKKAMNPAAVAGMLEGLKGKGLPKSALDEVITWLKEQKAGAPCATPEDKYPSPQGKKKNLSVSVLEDGSVVVEGEQINKSRKFTEARTSTVKEVVTQLVNLLNEVDEDAAKALVASFKELPCGKAPESYNPAVGTTKALEQEVAQLTKRLEDIEKARQPSKSVSGEGGTDRQTNVKKCLWDGVL